MSLLLVVRFAHVACMPKGNWQGMDGVAVAMRDEHLKYAWWALCMMQDKEVLLIVCSPTITTTTVSPLVQIALGGRGS